MPSSKHTRTQASWHGKQNPKNLEFTQIHILHKRKGVSDLLGMYSSSVFDSSASSTRGISLLPPATVFFTRALLLLRGGMKGSDVGSRRPRGFGAVHASRLPSNLASFRWPLNPTLLAHTHQLAAWTKAGSSSTNTQRASKRGGRSGRAAEGRGLWALVDVSERDKISTIHVFTPWPLEQSSLQITKKRLSFTQLVCVNLNIYSTVTERT